LAYSEGDRTPPLPVFPPVGANTAALRLSVGWTRGPSDGDSSSGTVGPVEPAVRNRPVRFRRLAGSAMCF